MKKLIATGLFTLALSSQAFAEADYQALGDIASRTADQISIMKSQVGGVATSSPTSPTPVEDPAVSSGGSWVIENDAEVIRHLDLAADRLREAANNAFAAQDARVKGNTRDMVERGSFACGAVNRAWSMLSVANAKAFEAEPFGGASRYLPFAGQIASYRDDINIAYYSHCK